MINSFYKKIFFTGVISMLFVACGNESVPRPRGYFRIDLPLSSYDTISCEECIFSSIKSTKGVFKFENKENQSIKYPSLNAEIFITSKVVDNKNIWELIKSAESLTYKHSIKSKGIDENVFQQDSLNIYGVFYNLKGEVASSTQFYITDQKQMLVRGGVYINSKPNIDSLKPVMDFLQQESKVFVENFRWKENVSKKKTLKKRISRKVIPKKNIPQNIPKYTIPKDTIPKQKLNTPKDDE